MHQLVRRLDASDPEAGEALRIVTYFDVLITRDAGLDSLLRGAAMLSGAVAGAEFRGRISRRDPGGRLLDEGSAAPRSPERSGDTWRVWLEREGPARAGDEMIADRLAFGVALLDGRRGGERGIELALDPAHPVSERLAALARHRVDTTAPVRVVATLPEAPAPAGPSAIVPTRFGLLRATFDVGGADPYPGRIGFGLRKRPDEAPESWEAAILALHLTDPEKMPAFDATELGAMLLLVQSCDPRHPHPDVRALAALDNRSSEVLLALVEADSLRSAAARLDMHHSTVQARHEALTEALGYDPRSNLGRMRYIAAALLYRFTDSLPPHLGGRG